MDTALQIINEEMDGMEFEQGGNEGFRVTDDFSAEWSLKKIKAEQAEHDRYVKICQDAIQTYQEKIKEAQGRLDSGTVYLKGLLLDYFQLVPHKSTKTQETYLLPSGKLKLKFPGPEFKRDNDFLVAWLKGHEMNGYVKVVETPQWDELKKIIQQQDNFVCIDGEIVDGVTLVERPPTFEVNV